MRSGLTGLPGPGFLFLAPCLDLGGLASDITGNSGTASRFRSSRTKVVCLSFLPKAFIENENVNMIIGWNIFTLPVSGASTVAGSWKQGQRVFKPIDGKTHPSQLSFATMSVGQL